MAFSLGGRGSELGILVFLLSLRRRFPSAENKSKNFETIEVNRAKLNNNEGKKVMNFVAENWLFFGFQIAAHLT